MKTITRYISIGLLFTCISFSSCTKLLDIQPIYSMKPKTISEFEAVLLGGYPKTDYCMNTELLTDNVMVNLRAGSEVPASLEPWYVFASSYIIDDKDLDTYWGQLYRSIFYANTVLDRFQEITPDAAEKENYEKIKGEALALRAYSYFYLINMYADIYSADNMNLPGVPMPLNALDVNETSKNNSRKPIAEVWTQITKDLKDAADLLMGKPETSRFRFNSTTVAFLQARVALFMGDYELAVTYASAVMDRAPLADLNTIQAYIDRHEFLYPFDFNFGFIDTDYNKEILFFTGGRANNGPLSYIYNPFKPTEELLELTKRNGDLTDYRQYIFDSFRNFTDPDDYRVGKTVYMMFATQDNYWYHIGLKASEAYVIRAEAYARLQQYDKALNDINNLLIKRYKQGAFIPLRVSDYSDKSDLLKRILDERRLETAFDGGLRFFDLRRLGKSEIRHVYKNGQEFILKKNDPKYVLQIPLSEQNNSPEMPVNPR